MVGWKAVKRNQVGSGVAASLILIAMSKFFRDESSQQTNKISCGTAAYGRFFSHTYVLIPRRG